MEKESGEEEPGGPPAPIQAADLDYGELLKKSWDVFVQHPVELILGPILAGLTALLIITGGPVMTGICLLSLKAARGQDVSIGDAFSGYGRFVPSLIAALLVFLIVMVGTILLIIPGIIAAILLMWTFYYLADDEQATSAEAMKASYHMAKQNVVPVIVTLIIVWVLNIVGNLLVIGWLVTMPLGMVFSALVFDELKKTVPEEPRHSPLP